MEFPAPMSEQVQCVVLSVIDQKTTPLLLNGEEFMNYEIAVEQALKHIISLGDPHNWKPVNPISSELQRWENSKGDLVIIKQVFRI